MDIKVLSLLLVPLLLFSHVISSQGFDIDKNQVIDLLSPQEQYDLVNNWNTKKVQQRNTKTHILDSLHYYSTVNDTRPFGISFKSIFEYSDTLQVVKDYTFDYEISPSIDGAWNAISFVKYHLNSEGQLILRTDHPSWSGSEDEINTLTPTRLFEYIYNADGLLDSINKKVTTFPHEPITLTQTKVYNYDTTNSLIKISTFNRQRIEEVDTMILYSALIYRHNATEQLESIVEYSAFRDIPWTAIDSIHYSYDTEGHLKTRVEYDGRVELLEYPDYIYHYKNYPSGAPDTIDIRRHKHIESVEDSRFLEVYESQLSGDPGNMRARFWRDSILIGNGYGSFQENDPIISFEDVFYPKLFEVLYGSWKNMILYEEAYNNFSGTQRAIEHFVDWSFARYYFYSEIGTSSTTIESSRSESLLVFPNPASHSIQISHNRIQKGKEVDLLILDFQGKAIKSEKYKVGSSLTVAELPDGVYCVLIEDGGISFKERFIKI